MHFVGIPMWHFVGILMWHFVGIPMWQGLVCDYIIIFQLATASMFKKGQIMKRIVESVYHFVSISMWQESLVSDNFFNAVLPV